MLLGGLRPPSPLARSVCPGAEPPEPPDPRELLGRRDRCRLLGTGADEAFVLLVSCAGHVQSRVGRASAHDTPNTQLLLETQHLVVTLV